MRSARCATACCRPLRRRSTCRPISSRRFRERGARQSALPPLPAAGYGRGQPVRSGAAHRQQFHDRARPHRRARARRAAASGEWFPPPIIPGTFLINLGNIMRRWSNDRFLSTPHGVLMTAAPTDTRSPISTARTRTASSNACRAASALTTRRATHPPSIATSSSNSTAPIISTKRATNPTRQRSAGGQIAGELGIASSLRSSHDKL